MTIKKQQILLCPGPVIVSGSIFEAMANNIGHREEEFSDLLERVNQNLLSLFEIRKRHLYHPLVITGSGTVANETVLSSIVGSKHILVLANGEFGGRLATISKLHNKNTHIISFDWGKEINIQTVEKFLKTKKVDIIAMVHHETSVGMLNPVKTVGALAKKYNKIFYVDAVSSAGAEKIDMEKWNISFCTTSSGKAICSVPGLGIIMVKKSMVKKLEKTPVRTMYMNLFNLYNYSIQHKQTPNTPAVHLFYALDQALTNILKKGVVEARNEIKRKALIFRQGMSKMGFDFIIDEKLMSSALTTVYIPEGMKASKLRAALKEKDIIVYNGKGPFVDKVFQVGHIGEIKEHDIRLFLESLKNAVFPKTSSLRSRLHFAHPRVLNYNLFLSHPKKHHV